MPTPTVSIHVPMLERNAPIQNAAKTRCRKGAKGPVDRGAGAAAGGHRVVGGAGVIAEVCQPS